MSIGPEPGGWVLARFARDPAATLDAGDARNAAKAGGEGGAKIALAIWLWLEKNSPGAFELVAKGG